MATKQTASELYAEHREDIFRLWDWCQLEMDKHANNALANQDDWTFPGDLGHVRQKLIETLAFLSSKEPDNIDKLLGECRWA